MVYLKSVENVITLGKLIGLLFLFCLPLLSILFLKTKRNDLARPVMGTIFLVIPRNQVWLSRDTVPLMWACIHASLVSPPDILNLRLQDSQSIDTKTNKNNNTRSWRVGSTHKQCA